MRRLWRGLPLGARILMKQPMIILIAVATLALSAGFTLGEERNDSTGCPSDAVPQL
jgi:hypothetical protein